MKTKQLSESVFLGVCVSALKNLMESSFPQGKIPDQFKGAPEKVVNRVWGKYKSRTPFTYHDKIHILSVASWVLHNVTRTRDISHDALYIAVLYHDVIFNPLSHANEEHSVEVMVSDLVSLGITDDFIKQISECILDTKHDKTPKTETGKCMVDADLYSLANPIEEVWSDTRRLWKESGRSAEDFAKGNASFLRPIIDRPTVYYTCYMHTHETTAWENLVSVVDRLNSGLLESPEPVMA